jgi:hypothetical protein
MHHRTMRAHTYHGTPGIYNQTGQAGAEAEYDYQYEDLMKHNQQ